MLLSDAYYIQSALTHLYSNINWLKLYLLIPLYLLRSKVYICTNILYALYVYVQGILVAGSFSLQSCVHLPVSKPHWTLLLRPNINDTHFMMNWSFVWCFWLGILSLEVLVVFHIKISMIVLCCVFAAWYSCLFRLGLTWGKRAEVWAGCCLLQFNVICLCNQELKFAPSS